MRQAGTGTGGAAVAVVVPVAVPLLLLLLLARSPPAAAGDGQKSGERARTRGRHPGGSGWGAEETVGGAAGIVSHLGAPVRSPGADVGPRSPPWVGGAGRPLAGHRV